MKYARIVNSQVIEIIETPDNVSINECLVPELAAQCVPCSGEVSAYWSYVDGKFISPSKTDSAE